MTYKKEESNELNQIPLPEKIRNPVQLVAYFGSAICFIVWILSTQINSIYLGLIAIFLLTIIAGAVILRYESISDIEKIKKHYTILLTIEEKYKKLLIEKDRWSSISGLIDFPDPQEKLSQNLTLMNSDGLILWNERIKPAFENMGYIINESATKTMIGDQYYYTEVEKDHKKIELIFLKNSYFLFGNQWKDNKWLNYICNITDGTNLIIISDNKIFCDEALHEKEDLEVNGKKILFISKSLKEWLEKGDVELTKKYLQSRIA